MDFPGNQPIPVALPPYKGHFPNRLLLWPLVLGTSMTRDMSGFQDIILKSKPY